MNRSVSATLFARTAPRSASAASASPASSARSDRIGWVPQRKRRMSGAGSNPVSKANGRACAHQPASGCVTSA